MLVLNTKSDCQLVPVLPATHEYADYKIESDGLEVGRTKFRNNEWILVPASSLEVAFTIDFVANVWRQLRQRMSTLASNPFPNPEK